MKLRTLLPFIGIFLVLSSPIVAMDHLEEGWEIVRHDNPSISSTLSTAWNLWDTAERCRKGNWSVLISKAHKLGKKAIGEELFTDAQRQIDTLLDHIDSIEAPDNTDVIFQRTIDTCVTHIKELLSQEKAGKPDLQDSIYKYQTFFLFENYIPLLQEKEKNPLKKAFGKALKKAAQKLVEKRFQPDRELPNVPRVLSDPKKARVRSDIALGGMTTREHDWVQKRLKEIVKPQNKLFSEILGHKKYKDFTPDPLRIGIAFSGGGYRAMTLSAGYLVALKKLDILDASLYISSLSGSTWLLARWLLSGRKPAEFQKDLSTRIVDANIAHLAANPSPEMIDDFIHDVIIPKAVCDKSVSSVDIYGGLLAYGLLRGYEKQCHRFTMLDIANKIHEAKVPFPIFTAISEHPIATHNSREESGYNWYEFNPYSVENVHLTLPIPTATFGSSFVEGICKDVSPHQESLGSLMGIWGSAWTINFMKNIDKKHVGDLGPRVAYLASYIFPSIGQLMKNEQRFYPASAPNPYLGINLQDRLESSLNKDYPTSQKQSVFVDAGIDFNLPILPLLKRMRQLDVVIVADSSGDISKRPDEATSSEICPQELALFFEKAKSERIFYKNVPVIGTGIYVYQPDNTKKRTAKSFTGKKLPVIIYINYECDRELMQKILDSNNEELKKLIIENDIMKFSPATCTEGYGSTFSFRYSPQEFTQLAATGEFNILARKKEIMEILTAVYENKLSPGTPLVLKENRIEPFDLVENFTGDQDSL